MIEIKKTASPRMAGEIAKKGESKPAKDKVKIESKKQRKARYEREDAEARSLGISYGKYQMLKQQGKLPKKIKIKPLPKAEKIGVLDSAANKGYKDSYDRRANQTLMEVLEAREEKRRNIKNGDAAVTRYMAIYQRQKEAQGK